MGALRRLPRSPAAVVALTGWAALTAALAVWPAPGSVIGIAAVILTVADWWVAQVRPGPVHTALATVGLLAVGAGSVAHGHGAGWVTAVIVVAVLAVVLDEPLGRRVVPQLRATQLPGTPSDTKPGLPGPFAEVAPLATALLALILIIDHWWSVPTAEYALALLVVLARILRRVLLLRAAVAARRDGSVNRRVTEALNAYGPHFYLYFSGPMEQDYQVRMWLPYLCRLDVPFAILGRDPKLLARAASITDAPVVVSERLAGLDDAMVPSVRAIFYVNTHSKCVDGVRYLDRTHVHLNHGDSDKPSSYHPMIASFDQIFVAGQAAIDRFARHGVLVPAEKFVPVGRPQVSGIATDNADPLPGRRTVLYAPTWQGGVRDMSFSSLEHGEQIVSMLLDRGVRVAFRPHPISRRKRHSARIIAAIDARLEAARTPACPHLASAQTQNERIADSFNLSDALVTDVSSVASDYLQSSKPLAVVDVATGGGLRPDRAEYPVLRAAYLLDLNEDAGAALDTMLHADPLAQTRRELRSYYLGDHPDSAQSFVTAARHALGDTRP